MIPDTGPESIEAVACLVCERAPATHACALGCSYCGECAAELGMRCRNCGGELTPAAPA